MVEPLTERELEILRLLTTHLSSTDIAGELTISVNTVRTHIKSIYGKLGAHSREEAVQKAEAAILEPIMNIEVAIPEEFFGDVIGDITI